jgi:glycosyltransferase involved in cell wall biosynthesis
MEDEIHQLCPIVWWHVWDNYPYPKFNNSLYEATDLINCHSHMTYTMLKDKFPNKAKFIPHALPEGIFYPLDDNQKRIQKREILGLDREDHFVAIWVNRNAKRKRPSDVLNSWKLFLDKLHQKHRHKKATLIMHTDPFDQEGPNLLAVSENLGIQTNVLMSSDRIDFEKMNVLYNISDCCINISYAEGFGLSTLEAMMTGTPIVAAKTGGLTRQVVNYKDGTENGVALDIKMQTMVGSQAVPYIYEDYATCEDAAKGYLKLFEMNNIEKSKLSEKVLRYAREEFSMHKTVDLWHESMINKIEDWKEKYQRITIKEY